MNYYLQYQTKGGKVKDRFFPTAQKRWAFILSSGCQVLAMRDF